MNHSKQKKNTFQIPFSSSLCLCFSLFQTVSIFQMILQMLSKHVHEKMASTCSFVCSKSRPNPTRISQRRTSPPNDTNPFCSVNLFFCFGLMEGSKALISGNHRCQWVANYCIIYSFPKMIMEKILDREWLFQD